MTTPPHANTPDPNNPGHHSHDTQTQRTAAPPNATGPDSARRGLPGWAWAFLGGLIVVAVVIAGVMIAGRNHTTPTATASDTATSATPTPTTPEPTTVSPTSGVTQIGEWSVEVLEYKPDVTDYLANANPPINLTVGDNRFLGIKLRVTNTGNEQADPYPDLGERLDGIENGRPASEPYYINTIDYRGDDYLSKVSWLYPGESGEGWLFYQVRGDFDLTTIEMQDMRDPNNETPWTSVPFPAPTETTSTPTTTP